MNKNNLTRRRFLTSAAAYGSGLLYAPNIIKNLYQNSSLINGVQIGVITYSFREMPDTNPEAILEYIKQTGVGAVELMGDHAEVFAGKPKNPVNMQEVFPLMRLRFEKKEMSDDQKKQLAEVDAKITDYKKQVAAWRASASFDPFQKLKKMYEAAGIKIYAYKPDAFSTTNTDNEINFGMKAAKALGANQITLEHPGNDAHTLKLGTMAKANKIYVGYHGHEQQTFNFWDTALSQSKYNALNLDLGHYIAAGNTTALELINKQHKRIVSMHIKDRQNKEHGKANLVWGSGDTPIAEALRTMRDKKYKFPATIELEYKIPEGSNSVMEVKKCLDFAKKALMA